MPESLLPFLTSLPAGLLLAAACVEGFLLSRRDRDCEPAVLWLLCCAAFAAALATVAGLALYFVRLNPSGLRMAAGGGLTVALASLAWIFKRQARNRTFLLLRERFYDTSNANLPPRRKPWQAFLILGYRAVLALAILLPPLVLLWPGPPGSPAPTASVPPPAPAKVAETASPQPLPAAAIPVPAVPAITDPTKSEIPSAEASALAALASSVAMPPPAAVPVPSAPAPAELPVAVPSPEIVSRPVSKNSVYFSKVRPILTKSCTSCHGGTKQKGDLRLDTPDFIRAGVNGKPIIVPGVPEKSRLYHVTTLPADDTDRMPPKGTPLNATERAVLADWIKNGADLGDGVSIPAGKDGVFLVDTLAASLSPPDPRLLEDLKKDHVLVRPLSKNGYVLELDFSHSDRAQGDLKLSQLGPLAMNIYALDFSRTAVRDEDLGQLLPMKNLSRLLLSRTAITDAGLAFLGHNGNLEQLNLYNTAVSDAGLTALAPLKSLKKIYLWQSKATPEGARRLQEEVPGLVVSLGQ